MEQPEYQRVPYQESSRSMREHRQKGAAVREDSTELLEQPFLVRAP